MGLRLLLLGPFKATIDGQDVSESRAKRIEALLVYLAVESNYAHRREKLVGLLFPELPDDQARTNLRQTIKRLRSSISQDQKEPFLLVTRESIQFNQTSDFYLDTEEFVKLLDGCPDHLNHRDPTCKDCMSLARKAVELYRGPFLDDLFLEDSSAFEEWLLSHREQFQQQFFQALFRLAAYHERRGEYDQAVHYCRRQLTFEPWREETHRQLIRLLAYQGQRTAALQQYELLKETLWNELAVEPMPETSSLRRIVSTATEIRPHNLPVRDYSFVGREEELAKIREQLVDPEKRLLTLLGTGGCGKTALAVEVAWRVTSLYLGPFLHGVYFVPLANVAPGDGVQGEKLNPLVTAVAEAVSFPFAGAQNPQQQLLNFLKDRSLLLILDNVEHLLSQSRSFVTALLEHSRVLSILVTSRSRLNLPDERLLEINGLPYSSQASQTLPGGTDALELFRQRAKRVVPDFEIAREEEPKTDMGCRQGDVVEICRLLQGLPLGIELAASWVRFLGCHEIANEIGQSLDFLQRTTAGGPVRQQSLRAAFDYSWDLLAEQERQVLGALSVFAGSFDRAAAAAVGQATLSQLAALTDHSLLRIYQGSEPGSRRFELLEVLRQYASEKLVAASGATETDAADNHASYYLGFLGSQLAALRGEGQQLALSRISNELPNIRKAWRWAAQQQKIELVDMSLDALALYYYMHSLFAEGADIFQLAASNLVSIIPDGQDYPLLGRLRMQQGWFNFLQGQQLLGRELLSESVDILRNSGRAQDLALALGFLVVIAYTAGEYELADRLAGEAYDIAEAGQEAYTVNVTTNVLSQLKYRIGDYSPARQYGEQSLSLARQRKDPWSIGFSLVNLGRVAYIMGEIVAAESLFQEALATRKQIGDARGQALCRLYLGDTAVARGDSASGIRYWYESLGYFEDIGNLEGISAASTRLGWSERQSGRPVEAQRLFLRALRLSHKAQATPRVLDALVGLASLLTSGSGITENLINIDKALAIAHLVLDHPAASRESRVKASELLAAHAPAIAKETTALPDAGTLDERVDQLVGNLLKKV